MLNDAERAAAEHLIDLALAEDLGETGDLTCRALIDDAATGAIDVVSREPGVLAGGPVAELVFANLDGRVTWQSRLADGERLERGSVAATVSGPLKSLLAGERTALNVLGHLSGIASLTRRNVDAVAGTDAAVLDTRKTLPGYRLLQKYAVRQGGGVNHRLGLFDGVLIKDNHVAAWAAAHGGGRLAEAVARARAVTSAGIPIEVEVDSLEQLREVLPAGPDIVLLDNFDLASLREAVRLRDGNAPDVRLEASGGVTLETIGDVARTGVDRISVGALTHSARNLDLGFDWKRSFS